MKKLVKIIVVLVLVLILGRFLFYQLSKNSQGEEIISQLKEKVLENNWSVDLKELEMETKIDINESIMFDENYVVWSDDLEREKIEIGNVKKIKIEAAGVILSINDSEDEFCYIEGTNIGKLQSFVKEDTLYIMSTKNFNVKEDNISRIILSIPKNQMFEMITFKFGAGQFIIETINTKKLFASIGAGEFIIKSGKVENFEIEVGAGNCIVSKVEVIDGSITCAAGRVELELIGKKTDYNYGITSIAGSVKIGEDIYTGLSQKKKINNGANKNIEIECTIGNVSIIF